LSSPTPGLDPPEAMFGLGRLLGVKAVPSDGQLPVQEDKAQGCADQAKALPVSPASLVTTPGSSVTCGETPSAASDASPWDGAAAEDLVPPSGLHSSPNGDQDGGSFGKTLTGQSEAASQASTRWDSSPAMTSSPMPTPSGFGFRRDPDVPDAIAESYEEHQEQEGVVRVASAALSKMGGVAGQELSTGSDLHEKGECNPCVWYWKPQGCLRGQECGYCHLCPDGEVKVRKKAKLAAIRTNSSLSLLSGDAVDDQQSPTKQGREKLQDFVDSQESTHMCEEDELKSLKMDKAATPHGRDEDKAKEGLQLSELLRSELENVPGFDIGGPLEKVPEAVNLIKPPPGLTAPQSVPSAGSSMHGTGLCRPCAWLWKPQGCQNGQECRHCHLCPEGELKARRKVKVDVMRMQNDDEDEEISLPRKQLSLVEALGGESGPGLEEDLNYFDLAGTLKLDAVELPPESSDFSPHAAQHVFPSVGSALHGSGLCRPCAWFWKSRGCENAKDCRHCHLCPEVEIKNRRKMKVSALKTPSSAAAPHEMFPMTPMAMTPMFTPQAHSMLSLGSPLQMDLAAMTPMSMPAPRFFTGEEETPEKLSSDGVSSKMSISLATSLPMPSLSSAYFAGKSSQVSRIPVPSRTMRKA